MSISRFALVSALSLGVLAPRLGITCMNAVQLQTKEAAQLIAKAEKLLDEGKAKKAHYLLPEEAEIDDAKLRDRMTLLRAVARLRIGHVSIATQMLQYQLKAHPQDPYTVARMAEAQTAGKKDLDAAMAALTDLEKRDVMPDAEGWATLARLHDMKADAASRDRAIARCKQIAKRAEVCAINGKVASR